MTKPRVVLVHPPTKLFPYQIWPAAFDGLDVEVVTVECQHSGRCARSSRRRRRRHDRRIQGRRRGDRRDGRARAICGFGHGFEGVDVEAATRAGILVTNAAQICHLEVANHAAALLLALNRKLCQYDRAMRKGVWDRPAGRPITPLDGETAGLVGLGAIGQALARRLQPFGVRVIAYDPYVEEHVPKELGVHMVERSPHPPRQVGLGLRPVPLNAETRHLLGEREFRAMKRTAYLVNCCRGGVVDEAALTRVLEAGWIAGAAWTSSSRNRPTRRTPCCASRTSSPRLTPPASRPNRPRSRRAWRAGRRRPCCAASGRTASSTLPSTGACGQQGGSRDDWPHQRSRRPGTSSRSTPTRPRS